MRGRFLSVDSCSRNITSGNKKSVHQGSVGKLLYRGPSCCNLLLNPIMPSQFLGARDQQPRSKEYCFPSLLLRRMLYGAFVAQLPIDFRPQFSQRQLRRADQRCLCRDGVSRYRSLTLTLYLLFRHPPRSLKPGVSPACWWYRGIPGGKVAVHAHSQVIE